MFMQPNRRPAWWRQFLRGGKRSNNSLSIHGLVSRRLPERKETPSRARRTAPPTLPETKDIVRRVSPRWAQHLSRKREQWLRANSSERPSIQAVERCLAAAAYPTSTTRGAPAISGQARAGRVGTASQKLNSSPPPRLGMAVLAEESEFLLPLRRKFYLDDREFPCGAPRRIVRGSVLDAPPHDRDHARGPHAGQAGPPRLRAAAR